MNKARSNFASTVLFSGQLVVCGGVTTSGKTIGACEMLANKVW